MKAECYSASRVPCEPSPGLNAAAFKRICPNGFGDGHNAYAYAMAWYKDHLYVGTSRANLMLLKFAMPFVKMDIWPVECPYPNYSPEFEQRCARGEIWRYSQRQQTWERMYQAPLVTDDEGVEFARELGFRGMCVFKGKSDPEPALYATTWSRSRGSGPQVLRCVDGKTFELLPAPHFEQPGEGIVFTAIRSLIPFKGRLFTAPTGGSKGNVNGAGVALVYETDDPASGRWTRVNDPFDQFPEVVTVYELAALGDHLYAGTGGINGFQVWRTRAEGKPPYEWECLLRGGAGRGALNQGAVSMTPFNGGLYIGTGIQNGGYDWRNNIGPAAAEVIRLFPDGKWDIVVGNPRDDRESLSGLTAGFGNFFCGYIWRMGVHQGWLYAGTMDWSVILRYSNVESRPVRIAQLLAQAGVEEFIALQGGCDLWRTADGENWINVTRTGFGNPYNFGLRSIVSTPHGLFLGTANPFGPRVAKHQDGNIEYVENPAGGLEVLHGA